MSLTFIASGTSNGNAASHTVTLPSHSPGDLLLILFSGVDAYANGISIGSLPSGWAQVTGSPIDAGANWNRGWLCYKIAGSSEPNPTFSGWSASLQVAWGVAVYRGGHSSSPFDVTPVPFVGSDSTTMTTPAISPVSANTMLVCCAVPKTSAPSGGGYTTDAAMTERIDYNNGSYAHVWFADQAIAATGSTGTRTHTLSDAFAQMGFVLALREASGDTTAPVLSAPTGTSTGTSTATVGATTDEGNGTLYAVVTTSATQPSVAQIKAGQNHTGAAATWSGSLAISSTGAKTLNATGLSQGTTYYAHLVHNDAANNDSNRVVSASFTTSAVTITDAGDETFQPGESITITGTTFGASQGSGKVYLSPTNSIADGSKVEQTVTSWGASSITITVEKGALPYGAAYLFVQENGGVSNAAGYAVSFITRGAQRSMLLGIG